MRRWFPLLLVPGLLLAGCSVKSAETGVINVCEQELQYEIEQGVPEPAGGWVDSELTTSNVKVTQRPNEDVEAFDISGTAHVALESGRTITVDWGCFGQRYEGRDSAAIMSIDGYCSTVYTGNDPSVCTPRE